jgi:hypothetical protein
MSYELSKNYRLLSIPLCPTLREILRIMCTLWFNYFLLCLSSTVNAVFNNTKILGQTLFAYPICYLANSLLNSLKERRFNWADSVRGNKSNICLNLSSISSNGI